jgi:uncharacterized protein YqjF (DUF2071 family)
VPFLTAEWRHLAMLNYEVDASVVAPLLPRGTEVDFWEGKTYLSVVGFLFLDTRVLGVPIPFHRNFEEVNLRFYVRRKGPEGWRRGVVFVKELVPRRAIASLARALYNENYVAVPMGHSLELAADVPGRIQSVSYRWRLGGREHGLRIRTDGDPQPLSPGSHEEFIAEHYWGYTAQRDGSTVEYRVTHPTWRVSASSEARLDCDVAVVYGERFRPFLAGQPTTAFLAEGSPITVSAGIRM